MKYQLLAVLLLFGCKNINLNNNDYKISKEVVDTIKVIPAKIVAMPYLFEQAYNKGFTQTVNNFKVNLYGITIGKIKISSGRIITCDPLHIDEYGIAYTQIFPTGEFPVQLSIAKLDEEESIAFARINFSEDIVERWELALQPGQSALPVAAEKIHGFSVDGGVGIFVDEAAVKTLDIDKLQSLDAPLYKEMEQHYHFDWRYALHNFGQHNLAAFSTGFGDGYFATYIGFNSKGIPCRLLTDFGLLKWKNK
ncbi:MAG: DUF4241 domain-containing protein [Bacteroidota bacterium]